MCIVDGSRGKRIPAVPACALPVLPGNGAGFGMQTGDISCLYDPGHIITSDYDLLNPGFHVRIHWQPGQ